MPQHFRDGTRLTRQLQVQDLVFPRENLPFPPTEHGATQMGLGVLPPWWASTAHSLSDNLQNLQPMLATPPVSLPPVFSALARAEPDSQVFLPILETFLRSTREHELLTQLEGSAAVYVADVLDKVRNHFQAVSCESRAKFRAVFGCPSVLLSPRMVQAHPPRTALIMRVVWGVAHLLHV